MVPPHHGMASHNAQHGGARGALCQVEEARSRAQRLWIARFRCRDAGTHSCREGDGLVTARGRRGHGGRLRRRAAGVQGDATILGQGIHDPKNLPPGEPGFTRE